MKVLIMPTKRLTIRASKSSDVRSLTKYNKGLNHVVEQAFLRGNIPTM